MLILDLAGKFEADVVKRHAVLLFLVHRKTERAHLPRIVRISLKVKDSGALAVVEKPFAVELACVARDGEVHVLPARFGEVNSGECARRPRGLGIRVSTVMMLDQRELDFARRV